MSDYIPEVIQFSIPFIFILLTLMVAAVVAFFFYRQTNPDETPVKKIILASLRALIILFLLILLFKPKLVLQFIERKPQKIAVIIDNSASMALNNQKENRRQSTEDIAGKIEKGLQNYNVEVSTYYFNHSILDSVVKPFGPTNFEIVFRNIAQNQLNKIVLVSDGIRTEGSLPILNTAVPVYTMGIGNLQPEPDVFIADVDFKPVVYQGKEQMIVAKISSQNYSGKNIKVTLFAENKLIRSENKVLPQNGSVIDVPFHFKPSESGVINYKIEILPDKEDALIQNNKFLFSQEIVKSKIRIGLYASFPGNDLKFIKFVTEKNEDFDLHTYLKILNKPVEKIIPADSMDAFILLGYPDKTTSSAEIDRILYNLEKNNQGIIIILNEHTDQGKLLKFEKFLPFTTISKKRNIAEINPTVDNINNIFLRLYETPQDNVGFLNSVPPVFTHYHMELPKNSTELVLNGSRKGETEHIISSYEKNSIKSILVNGSGLWRWHFALQDNAKYADGYQKLITNIIRWATNRNRFKPVVLELNKKSVSPGQEIKLSGFLFDAQNNPVFDGRITVEARWSDQNFSIKLDPDSTGGYYANYTPFNIGRYVFSARGFDNTGEIGLDEKILDVLPYNREFIHTTQDSAFLKRIANQTNGNYYTGEQVNKLLTDLDLGELRKRKSEEIDIRFYPWFLYVIIGIITLEWSIRKFRNLV